MMKIGHKCFGNGLNFPYSFLLLKINKEVVLFPGDFSDRMDRGILDKIASNDALERNYRAGVVELLGIGEGC